MTYPYFRGLSVAPTTATTVEGPLSRDAMSFLTLES
jgi:hypothetical protein